MLKTFPYYQNYIDLARMELSAILPILPQDEPLEKIAFIGNGPLPLTSFCLSQLLRENNPTLHLGNKTQSPTNPQILNIDSSPTAISLSTALATALSQHFPSQLFACEPAGHPSRDLTPYTVVFLAALVGATQSDKEDILLTVVRQMRSGSLIVVRTSHGLRRVLYPEFEFATEKVLSVMEVLAVVHPYSHVVNSVVVGRVR
jgi:nicotianamine synthase